MRFASTGDAVDLGTRRAVQGFAGVVGAIALLAMAHGDSSSAATDGTESRLRPAAEGGIVRRVVDGDTIVVSMRGQIQRVRFLGADAPGVGECYGAVAAAAVRRFVLGRRVRIVRDRTQPPRDASGRVLAYVERVGGADVGLLMLKRGFAVLADTRRPFTRYRKYADAAADASESAAGLWAACFDAD